MGKGTAQAVAEIPVLVANTPKPWPDAPAISSSIAETFRRRLDNGLFSLVGQLPLHLSQQARQLGAGAASTSEKEAFILPSP